MKKIFLMAAVTLMSLSAVADEWQLPAYTGGYQTFNPGDTVYIYNTEAKGFLTEGNDWGTHATVGAEGLLYTTAAVQDESGATLENTYTFRNYSVAKSGWRNLFITDGGNMYVDYNKSGDIYFSVKSAGTNTYTIYGAASNATWNTTLEGQEEYLVGCYSEYTNAQTSVTTGTGVIFSYPNPDLGTMYNTWAFVSQADYAVYYAKVATYNKAQELKARIDTVQAKGLNTEAAQQVYDNTASTLDELQAAIDALDAALARDVVAQELKALIDKGDAYGVETDEATKIYEDPNSTVEDLQRGIALVNAAIMSYYQDQVSPEEPLDLTAQIKNPTFDDATNWTNNINATTFNTGTWMDETWEEGAFDGTYLNVWGASMQGTISQTLTGLPNGVYVIGLSVYHDGGTVTVYANDDEKSVPVKSTTNKFQVTTCVKDGVLELGVRQSDAVTDWMVVDNATLTYYGCGVDAYKYWVKLLLKSAPKFDEVTVQDSLLAEYNKVLASVDEAQDEESILAVIPAYEKMLDEINANVDAYTSLKTLITSSQTAVDEGTTYYNNLINQYISTTAQPAVDKHVLGTDAINAITNQLQTDVDDMTACNANITELSTVLTNLQSALDVSTSVAATKSAANELIAKINAFDTDNCSNSEIKALLDEANDMIFKLSIPAEEASDTNPIDYTAKVADPSFDYGSGKWINDGWATCGYNSWATPADGERFDTNYLNLWNATGGCRVYQQFTDLPDGTYTFAIYAFADAAGFEVYANNDAFAVEATSGADDEGFYGHLYEVTTLVEGGTLEMGVRNVSEGAVWAMVDNATLTYYGTSSQRTPTCIDEVSPAVAQSATYYSLSGQRIAGRPTQRGIYIVGGKKVIFK